MSSDNDIEIKVAKLETKMDSIMATVSAINLKLDALSGDRVTHEELEEFKAEVRRQQLVRTLLTTILTFIVTALLSYVISDILGG